MAAFQRALATIGIGGSLFAAVPAGATEQSVQRDDFRVTTSDGVGIRVREIRPSRLRQGEPLILIHGARVPGIGSFDLDVPDGSLAADLARMLGRVVLVMDARGYGGSDRSREMEQPAQESRPLSRAFEVVRDIDAVALAAMRRQGSNRVALLGWATGGMWASYYAALWPERVGELVTLNALYGGSDRHPSLGPGSANSDPERPDRLNPNLGGYAVYDPASLWPTWDRSIPVAEKATWRDPAVAEAYARAALSSDAQSSQRQPSAFRAPLGAIEDSFYQANGRRLFDASQITARTLVVRSERDFWSRPEDADSFAHDAVRARELRVLTLPNATHYVHLDRPERGRRLLLEAVASFLEQSRARGP